MDTRVILKKLSRLCHLWGGQLIELPHTEFQKFEDVDEYASAPFTGADLGILWTPKQIFYSTWLPVDPTHVIHEMGHVFAHKYDPNHAKAFEYDFLGWEYRLALVVGISHEEFVKSNKDYVVAEDNQPMCDLGLLSEREAVELLQSREARASELGLIVNGRPVAIR